MRQQLSSSSREVLVGEGDAGSVICFLSSDCREKYSSLSWPARAPMFARRFRTRWLLLLVRGRGRKKIESHGALD